MNHSRRTVVPLSRKWMTSSTWEQKCRARKRISESEKHLLGKPSTTWGKYGHLGCQRGSNWDSFMQLLKQSCCMDARLGPSPKHCSSLLTAAMPTWLGAERNVEGPHHKCPALRRYSTFNGEDQVEEVQARMTLSSPPRTTSKQVNCLGV